MAAKKPKKKSSSEDGTRQNVCQNRRARRNYDLGERLEAGLVLTGTEVKSCRAGKAHLNDAYVTVKDGEAWLLGAHIAEYDQGNRFNHEPDRTRKLLLNHREIEKLYGKVRERGFVAIPLAMYFKNGWVKVEIAIGKGRTTFDKREQVRDREVKRELQRIVRRGRR